MNQRIQQLYKQAHITQEKQVRAGGWDNDREPFEYRTVTETNFDPEKFAELIVRECCLALWTEECHTSDLAFDEVKRNDKRIKEHFGIDPNEITEAMLDRSIKWMEQQLVDKKHFGVEL
jgi:hypothetical protein